MINWKILPNILTILRIVSIPVIIFSFYLEKSFFTNIFGATLFVCASITDFLDGYLARKFNFFTSFGRIFDPIADKLLIGSIILMLVKYNKANEIACLLILSREFAVAGLREFLAQIKLSIPVSNLAKVKTLLQMVSFTVLILDSIVLGEQIVLFGRILLWITSILTLFTGFKYFFLVKNHFSLHK